MSTANKDYDNDDDDDDDDDDDKLTACLLRPFSLTSNIETAINKQEKPQDN